jgi:hypothetical protein
VLYNTYVTAVQRALAVEFLHRPPSPSAPGGTYGDPVGLSLEEWMLPDRGWPQVVTG